MTNYLVDTGPLVAFLNQRDQNHQWTVQQLSETQPPLLTCEAVLSEAFFLLRKHHSGTDALIKLLERQIVKVPFRFDKELSSVAKLLRRYADVEISLADACLVRMTELFSDCKLFTFDGDFRVYRRNGRQTVPTISPPQ